MKPAPNSDVPRSGLSDAQQPTQPAQQAARKPTQMSFELFAESLRQSMTEYPTFRSHGWQIGSGPTKSRCKITTSRLKGRGRRWEPENAEAVAAHTSLQDSQ